MAELILKVGTVGPDPFWQDGDIIEAFNRRRIRCVHAEHICDPRKAGFTRDGLRPNDSLARLAWFDIVYRYRFTRVSRTEVERLDQWNLTAEMFGPTPNEAGEYIDVPLFLARRLRSPAHRIFGTSGAEVWFGGKTDVSHGKLDQTWLRIEQNSAERESNYPRWPAGSLELRHMLCVAVDDFDDDDAAALIESQWDETDPESPILTRKRKRHVDWQSNLLMDANTKTKVLDKRYTVDLRDSVTFQRAVIVETK